MASNDGSRTESNKSLMISLLTAHTKSRLERNPQEPVGLEGVGGAYMPTRRIACGARYMFTTHTATNKRTNTVTVQLLLRTHTHTHSEFPQSKFPRLAHLSETNPTATSNNRIRIQNQHHKQQHQLTVPLVWAVACNIVRPNLAGRM
eukprot:m.64786 g.64786  ORF g.64786 m.64786 type:complete len:147 (+) comp12027_c0_seq1:360-800(+)